MRMNVALRFPHRETMSPNCHAPVPIWRHLEGLEPAYNQDVSADIHFVRRDFSGHSKRIVAASEIGAKEAELATLVVCYANRGSWLNGGPGTELMGKPGNEYGSLAILPAGAKIYVGQPPNLDAKGMNVLGRWNQGAICAWAWGTKPTRPQWSTGDEFEIDQIWGEWDRLEAIRQNPDGQSIEQCLEAAMLCGGFVVSNIGSHPLPFDTYNRSGVTGCRPIYPAYGSYWHDAGGKVEQTNYEPGKGHPGVSTDTTNHQWTGGQWLVTTQHEESSHGASDKQSVFVRSYEDLQKASEWARWIIDLREVDFQWNETRPLWELREKELYRCREKYFDTSGNCILEEVTPSRFNGTREDYIKALPWFTSRNVINGDRSAIRNARDFEVWLDEEFVGKFQVEEFRKKV